jgi:hypothetical protein
MLEMRIRRTKFSLHLRFDETGSSQDFSFLYRDTWRVFSAEDLYSDVLIPQINTWPS